MKVWIFVEGISDELALNALWRKWAQDLRSKGHGISIIPLEDKARFFRKLGPRAAEKLMGDAKDVVVGLPDLYPNKEFEPTPYRHVDLKGLVEVQKKLVREALVETQGVKKDKAAEQLKRFFPTALKHDLEMLLLAAREELKKVLGTQEALGKWRTPVEDQNQNQPPKRVIEGLFLRKSRRKRAYRDTRDAPAVLGQVANLHDLLHTGHGQVNCPVFRQMLDWVGEKCGVPVYSQPSAS